MTSLLHRLFPCFALFLTSGALHAEDSPQWLTYPGGEGPGKGKKIVLIAADQEYRSEQSMPMMAKILSKHHGFDCTVLFAVNEKGRWPSFKEKVETILPKVTGKDFIKSFPDEWAIINELKIFRDMIVHLKNDHLYGPNIFKPVFQKALSIDFNSTIWKVKDFINFYEPNLIEECNCGKDEEF